LFVTGNATATANNIAAHELLFRLGIVGDLLTGTMAIFLTLALYRLLKGVDQDLARLMVILGSLMVTPIYFLNTLNDSLRGSHRINESRQVLARGEIATVGTSILRMTQDRAAQVKRSWTTGVRRREGGTHERLRCNSQGHGS